MDAARSDLRRWADDARSVLSPLPAGPARAALESLCDVVVSRTA
jgi:heptaprenyl diphosphate synthase